MNPNDRRAKKTEKALFIALSVLLKEKPLREITINELVSQADLHRSTFYTHYADIYDLYKTVEDDFLNMLDEYLNTNSEGEYNRSIESIIDYLYENRWYCSILFSPNAELSFTTRVTNLLAENYLKICAYEEGITEIPAKWHLFAAYHMGGNFNLIKYWFETDFSFPKDTLIQMIYNFDIGFDQMFSTT